MADRPDVHAQALEFSCSSCGAAPGTPCAEVGNPPGGWTHGARILLTDAAKATALIDVRLAGDAPPIVASPPAWADQQRSVLDAATTRYDRDAVLHRRVHITAELVRRDPYSQFATGWSARDQALARWAASVALVVAERPELLTGQPPVDPRPATQVIAGVLEPVISPYAGARIVPEAATAVVNALDLAGYEVTRRADRFAHLDHPGAVTVRIPTRGRCGTCTLEVSRGWQSDPRRGEVLILPWSHIQPGQDDDHVPTDVAAR